jgi:hypothetical protein
MSRRERLERWARVLERHDGPVKPFFGIEHLPRGERRALRGEQTPLAVAFADPVLRAEGLKGDSLGEVMGFFELTERQAHRLFCDCHYLGAMTPNAVAGRLRTIANGDGVPKFWTLAFWRGQR